MLNYVLMLIAEGGTTQRTSDDTVADNDHLEQNLLLWTAVALFVFVILLSILFVSRQQWKSRQLDIKLTIPPTPAHEALLSRTDQTDKRRRHYHQKSATDTAFDTNDHSQM